MDVNDPQNPLVSIVDFEGHSNILQRDTQLDTRETYLSLNLIVTKNSRKQYKCVCEGKFLPLKVRNIVRIAFVILRATSRS